jgi:hypothetical protein
VFSDFAADLLLRWNEEVRRLMQRPSRPPTTGSGPASARLAPNPREPT